MKWLMVNSIYLKVSVFYPLKDFALYLITHPCLNIKIDVQDRYAMTSSVCLSTSSSIRSRVLGHFLSPRHLLNVLHLQILFF